MGSTMNQDYSPYRMKITSLVVDMYRDWIIATPSKYPPNLHSRVQSKKGRVEHRDVAAMVGITQDDYIQFRACDAKYLTIIWEFTPGGNELKERMILRLSERRDPAWSFGSCHCCWKEGKRNFTDTRMTKHPLLVTAQDKNLPILGRCGCVVCNDCVRKIEFHPNNVDEMNVHCPYCGNKDSFLKHLRIWLVSAEVALA